MSRPPYGSDDDLDGDGYCETCGGCGVVECCGIEHFLRSHVEGQTNCPHESDFIEGIIDWWNFTNKKGKYKDE